MMRPNSLGPQAQKQSCPALSCRAPIIGALFLAGSYLEECSGLSPSLLAGPAPLGFAVNPRRAGKVLICFRG
jgi:hypothetical protein